MLLPIISHGYNIKQISKNDGLSNSAILSISQDDRGCIWLGTVDGVNTYDGTNVDNSDIFGRGNRVSGSVIDRIHKTAGGALWFMTNYGIDRYDPMSRSMKNFDGYTRKYKLRECDLTETFFVTETLGLVSYSEGQLVESKLDYPYPYENILEYFAAPDGLLWILGANGKCNTYKLSKGARGDTGGGGKSRLFHRIRLSQAARQILRLQ